MSSEKPSYWIVLWENAHGDQVKTTRYGYHDLVTFLAAFADRKCTPGCELISVTPHY